ncbi:phosphopantetheine-binding protein [Ruminiclostridium papyrosolvens DSM 2782]|uniref:Phosphopantetheine-binding protein n=1 Tax=Ruminiclostridium papyrosolvens DSM 2782 TaxID=588581 RepID=F1T7C3_9FIRM|nr:phosphopantetheine-binding protein [Ruminiclostridium papyrosolvens]EGD49371.1 phosphopantetheine-binding protein [Ruminiclostridium papyrosolvens DSM 2782]WES33502.1 phosphopantetheine-binding protein [Ruminiclostridium papyrosolvens DSM 2782]
MANENLAQIQNDLKELIVETYCKDKGVDSIALNCNIASAFMLNSVDALELLLKIEQKFDIEISDEYLNIDLLQDAEKLSEFIYNLKVEV